MWIGLFQLGDWVPLHHQVLTAGVAAVPATQVTAKIYNSSLTLVDTITLSPVNPDVWTGLFTGRWQVITAAGRIVVYEEGTNAVKHVERFDVEGGDVKGSVVALHSFRAPEGDYVIAQADTGTVYQGRGPY